jgi:hypothetical protein
MYPMMFGFLVLDCPSTIFSTGKLGLLKMGFVFFEPVIRGSQVQWIAVDK